MKRKIVKEEEILRKANSKGRRIPRREKIREQKWENIEGGKVLREERRRKAVPQVKGRE